MLSSDEWRAWVGDSTIAPLYYLFLGAFFNVFGPACCPFARPVGPRRPRGRGGGIPGPAPRGLVGLLAGVAYALYLSAAEMTCWTMTENLHTVLLAGSLALMARAAGSANTSLPGHYLGGLLLGLSGLTRSVSSAFVPVAALWRFSLGGPLAPRFRARTPAPPAPAAFLLLAGGLTPVFAWSLRNRGLGDEVPIETVGFYNLWDDNSRPLVPRERYDRQLRALEADADAAGLRPHRPPLHRAQRPRQPRSLRGQGGFQPSPFPPPRRSPQPAGEGVPRHRACGWPAPSFSTTCCCSARCRSSWRSWLGGAPSPTRRSDRGLDGLLRVHGARGLPLRDPLSQPARPRGLRGGRRRPLRSASSPERSAPTAGRRLRASGAALDRRRPQVRGPIGAERAQRPGAGRSEAPARSRGWPGCAGGGGPGRFPGP